VQFRGFLAQININQVTQDAIGDQGVSDMELMEELTISDVQHQSQNVMKYQAPLYRPGMVQVPFTTVKRLQARHYWISNTRCWVGLTFGVGELTNPELARAPMQCAG
jgi:hypothetical protein